MGSVTAYVNTIYSSPVSWIPAFLREQHVVHVWTVRGMGKKPVQQGKPEQFVTAVFSLPFLVSWELEMESWLTDVSLLLTDM